MTEEYGHIPDAFYLSQEEIETLRKSKKELTEYGKEKLRKLMNQPIEAKVSTEDFNKVMDAINQKQLKKSTNNYIPDDDVIEEMTGVKLTDEKKRELAEQREKLHAGFKQDENGKWYRPTLQELSKNERIELAEKEIAYIVMGGQDGREYANSIAFILQVLDSLKDD
jgi:HAMP domain-containing protein